MNPDEFLNHYKCSLPKGHINRLPVEEPLVRTRSLDAAPSPKAEAFVNNKSLVSFVSEVDGQVREDILNATLFAQMVANYEYPEEEDIEQWYRKFLEVMNNVGWNFPIKRFSSFRMRTDKFQMDRAVMDVMGTRIKGHKFAILLEALNALKGLSDSDNALILFERNGKHQLNKGNFQIGFAQPRGDSASMVVGAYLLSSSVNIRRLISHKAQKGKIKLKYLVLEGTLDLNRYGLFRNSIIERIGAVATNYIAKISELDF